MNDQREFYKTKRTSYEERARGLKSYISELTEMAARHGTDEAHIEEDIAKARADLEYYECQAGEWRWRLAAGNNEVIASGEGYRDRKDCLHAIELVKDSKDAPVEGAD